MPKHPHTRTFSLPGRWNINRFAFADGEADVQPSLLPAHFSIVFSHCQGIFLIFLRNNLEFIALFVQHAVILSGAALGRLRSE